MPSLRLLADDLTGALDTAVEFAGLCGPVEIRWADRLPAITPQSLAIDSETRECLRAQAAELTDRAFANARYVSFVEWHCSSALYDHRAADA